MMKILLIEDEKILRISLDKTLRVAGYGVHSCEDGKKALSILKKEKFDVVLTDIRLPGVDGTEIQKFVKEKFPDTKVILMTAFGSVESAVKALKMGAHDYLTKPFSPDELLHRMSQLRDYQSILVENIRLKEQLEEKPNLIGSDPAFLQVLDKIKLAAQGEHTILIEGESGTGKELIVDYIHELSPRKDDSLIKVNCSALPETLFESELFGHEKGAFTGAVKQSIGRFERANGGTLFLDDIDDLSKPLQVKLLRVIENREVERLGGNKIIPVDVRIVSATKTDLRKEVEKGKFRDDLFYRLNVVTIEVPPLRKRREDIPILAAHFLEKHGREHTITPAVLERLGEYDWPGNVRELENIIIQMIALIHGDTLVASLLPTHICKKKDTVESISQASLTLNQAMAKTEHKLIKDTLEKCKWRQKDSAEVLGIPRTTLRSKMKRYKLIK